ncbi:NUDIX hydrolase [Spirosoma taeanense]|uniref:NUDIX hydrolase n=1 Tax=Spirosoma taeanense TaxID=2735870 RepID=A0A6M5XZV7_9BACT|nr:NUDIX domain-containing protein [Spirosoma taeanense]QJW88087.1 NUDIX hydrolase [Spirosoma taeanense]
MGSTIPVIDQYLSQPDAFHPGVSLDNVIFSFHDHQLKILLIQLKGLHQWALPGGFIFKEEEVEQAAARILTGRTGLTDVFLQQFHVFSQRTRTLATMTRTMLEEEGHQLPKGHWLEQRFLTIGLYALVQYERVRPKPDEFSVACCWYDLNQLPELIFDHREIIQKALDSLRRHLNYQPVGYTLLPKEFPLKSLQAIYETILDRRLERSNFNRKILSYNILDRKDKLYTGASNKAPYLYSFNEERYFQALKQGLDKAF